MVRGWGGDMGGPSLIPCNSHVHQIKRKTKNKKQKTKTLPLKESDEDISDRYYTK